MGDFNELVEATRTTSRTFRATAGDAIAKEIDHVVSEARSAWPDATGRSAASLRVDGAVVSSDLRYTEFIHRGETWRRLIVDPVEESADPIARAIATEAVAHFQGV